MEEKYFLIFLFSSCSDLVIQCFHSFIRTERIKNRKKFQVLLSTRRTKKIFGLDPILILLGFSNPKLKVLRVVRFCNAQIKKTAPRIPITPARWSHFNFFNFKFFTF